MSNLKSRIFLILSLIALAAGLVAGVFFDQPPSEERIAARISGSLQRELERIDREAHELLREPLTTEAWKKVDDSFFLVQDLQVLDWTTNDFLPDLRTLQDTFSIRVLQVPVGDFLVKKWPVRRDTFLLSVLPLHKDHKIVNNYLSPVWNPTILPGPVRILDATDDGEAVRLANGEVVFKIRKLENQGTESAMNVTALTGISLAAAFFAVFIYGVAHRLHRERKYGSAFLVLGACLGGMRIAMVKFNFPNAFSDFALFDPHRFASSSFNASMGDLLLNTGCVMILCLYLFLNYPRMHVIKKLLMARPATQLMASSVCLIICFLSLLYTYLFIEIIYHNSSISFEITDSISFDGIRWVACLSLLGGGISTFLFIHVFFRITQLLTRRNWVKFGISLAVAASVFLVFFLLTQKSYWITWTIGIIYFTALFASGVVQQFARFTFKTFLYFLVVIVVLAVQGAVSLKKFSEERRIRDQFRFGNKFLVDQDVLGEFLLNESASEIAKDPYIRAVLHNPVLSKNSIRLKVMQVYLNTYFDRYDNQVYLYDASGESYGPEPAVNFASLIKNYQGETFKTAYPGIYFINTPTAEATKQYLVIIPVKHHQLAAGFVVINLKLKKVIPRNVYPELLVDNRFGHYFIGKEFSYAFYSHGVLANSFGDFNYDKEFNRQLLSDSHLYQQGVTEKGFYHAGLEDRNDQVAIVTARTYSWFSLVTNFSFLFVLGLVVVLVLLLITSATTWLSGGRLDYAARIQLYVYLAFFLPLLTVSITTLSLTSRGAEDQLRREYDERSRVLGVKMARPVQAVLKDPGNYRSENQITELAKLADLDATVYGMDGQMIASSQPLIFENQLTSTLINRSAWDAIAHDKENSFIANERIGKLHYNCSYVAIKSSETGTQLGILSIPFFGSAQSLEKIQINVLANILTVFVLVFILFSVLSFLIANGLTFPLRFIARSIKRTSLTDKNQLIQWNSSDEIGLLANEYNRMIKNLEQSRIELARVQKETAWREIAKQVAHEIKNPLTPMKLTLQQMDQLLNRNELTPDKTRKSVETLLSQLEILNEIATSFSTFARMPAPDLERIDLVGLLKNIVGLHQTYREGTVSLKLDNGSLEVLGNSQLLGRVFGNIILNALQSGRDGRMVHVQVSAAVHEKKCLVQFRDDGKGISPEIQDKVFLPHFSTKRTGSGLGLAIAKQGIEQTGGKIWFDTQPGSGTTFYIELQLAEDAGALPGR